MVECIDPSSYAYKRNAEVPRASLALIEIDYGNPMNYPLKACVTPETLEI